MKPWDRPEPDLVCEQISNSFEQIYWMSKESKLLDAEGFAIRLYGLTGKFKTTKSAVKSASFDDPRTVSEIRYRTFIETTATDRDFLMMVQDTYQKTITGINTNLNGKGLVEPVLVLPSHYVMRPKREESRLAVKLSRDSIVGSFSTQWDRINDWREPRLRQDVSDKLYRHGVRLWTLQERFWDGRLSPALILMDENDFVMAKMLM